MMREPPAAPMLECLAARLGCVYLSDLHCLPPGKQACLAELLRNMPAHAASPAAWNEAAFYLAALPAAPTAGEARAALLSWAESNAKRTLKTEGGTL